MMAAGARPERISGKAREARSATSAKSPAIASPKPKPKASPWTSGTLIKGWNRKAALTWRIRADSRRIAAGVRPARSRPVQKTLPRARMRKTRARGFDASSRSSASMASNITPVTSLPWLELSRVKVRTSAVRSITTSLPAEGLEGTLGFLLVMAARYRRNAGLSNGAGAIWIKEMSGSPIHSSECGERGKCSSPDSGRARLLISCCSRQLRKNSKMIGDYEAATLRSIRPRVLCQVEIKVVATEFPSAQQDSSVEGHIPSDLERRPRNSFSPDMDQILAAEISSHANPYAGDSKMALVA